VLVGRPGWGAVVQTIERLADARPGRLIWLRDLTSDDGLRWLYRRAACFLSLSQAEGFNMPLVESAMSARPILCSDLPIHRAVAPPWARFAAPSAGADSLWREIAEVASAPPSPGDVAAYRAIFGWNKIASRLLQSIETASATGFIAKPDNKLTSCR